MLKWIDVAICFIFGHRDIRYMIDFTRKKGFRKVCDSCGKVWK